MKAPSVSKFHAPRVAVIIPHFNYSDFIGDALLSVQEQTHTNFVCIVVDDQSTQAHFERANDEVAKLNDSRFTLVRQAENLGMVPAVYRGLDDTDAAFMAVLDPDDRYAPEFIAKMLAVHLNPYVYCPLASCDQHLLKLGDGIITSTLHTNGAEYLDSEAREIAEKSFAAFGFHRLVSPLEPGWHWTTTSSMMYRADAVRLIRPNRKLEYKGHADAYLANGCHMLGGSLLLRQPLVYRGVHDSNDFLAPVIFSMFQKQEKQGAIFRSDMAKRDVVEAFLANGGLDWFSASDLAEIINAHFTIDEIAKLVSDIPALSQILEKDGQNKV